MRVNGKVDLPANAYAHLEQSSLLGEKFVQLSPPSTGTAEGALADGDRIPLSRTNRNPEVEEVFGALSMLLNGGGVAQLKTITTELNKALAYQEPQIRSMLKRVDTLVTNLDDHKEDITAALDGVNRLSATLATRKQDVGTVLTGLTPGMKVLEKQRGSLLTMLRSLDTLSTVAVDTIDKSKADMIADLKAIAPTLTALADSGDDLPNSLQVLVTYPFTDEVLRGVKGDYLNVYLDVTAQPGTQVIPALTPPTESGTQKKQGRRCPCRSPRSPHRERRAPADDHSRHPAQEHRLPRRRRTRPRLPGGAVRRPRPLRRAARLLHRHGATPADRRALHPLQRQLPGRLRGQGRPDRAHRRRRRGRTAHRERRTADPRQPGGRRRQPLRRRRAVHRPAAHPRGRALPGERLGHRPGRHHDPRARHRRPHQRQRPDGLGRHGSPAHGRRRVRRRVQRAWRRPPGPAGHRR